MIKIYDLKESDKFGMEVVLYKHGNSPGEFGHITGWNERYIFVCFPHTCGRGIAVSPEDLTRSNLIGARPYRA